MSETLLGGYNEVKGEDSTEPNSDLRELAADMKAFADRLGECGVKPQSPPIHMADEELRQLCVEFEEEDRTLAEAGLLDWARGLDEFDAETKQRVRGRREYCL